MSRQDDKLSLSRLRETLGASKSSLRRDECGDWRILGSSGWIYADDDTFLIYVVCETPWKWRNAKQRLGFCPPHQDGDEEGYLRLSHWPSPEEAQAVRRVVRIRVAGKPPLHAFRSNTPTNSTD